MSAPDGLLEKALEVYAGPHVLQYVLTHGEAALVPNSQSRDATVMFASIGMFAEPEGGIAIERIGEWQTAYLQIMVREVAAEDGTLDTFVGENASAWWAAHLDEEDAERACRAALAILASVERLNELGRARRYPLVYPSLGIHSGKIAIGPYGTRERLKFGIIGDAVNLASALCRGLGGYGRSTIVVSEQTRTLAGSKFKYVPLKDLRSKGGAKVATYELCSG